LRTLRTGAMSAFRDHVEQARDVLLEVQHLAGQHLVQHDAGREDVGAVVDALAPGLLRGHVVVLALDHADRGLARLHRRLGDAEVDQLDLAGRRHQHVLRRHVAVDDAHRLAAAVALAVRVVQAVGHLLGHERRHVDRHLEIALRALAQDLVEVGAVDELHHDVVGFADPPEIEGVGDVDVLQLHRDLRLVDEHLDELLVLREVRVDHLQRDELLEPRQPPGLGQVDLRHAAHRDLADQRVGAERALSHGR
jgi:hypothetical protein